MIQSKKLQPKKVLEVWRQTDRTSVSDSLATTGKIDQESWSKCHKTLFSVVDASAKLTGVFVRVQVMHRTMLRAGLGSWYRIHNTPFSSQLMNRPNKLDCSLKQLERLTNVKRSNLLSQFLSYKENEVLWIRTLASLGKDCPEKLAREKHSSLVYPWHWQRKR